MLDTQSRAQFGPKQRTTCLSSIRSLKKETDRSDRFFHRLNLSSRRLVVPSKKQQIAPPVQQKKREGSSEKIFGRPENNKTIQATS